MSISAFLTMIFTSVSVTGFAAPAFELESGLRLSTSAAVYCVTPIANGYRMYFSTNSFMVLSATSSNGLVWSIEPGFRLSTQTDSADASSITAMGLYYDSGLAGKPYRAYYVGISSMGLYSVLSATSSDGLAWNKDGGFSIKFDSGLSRVNSPAPYFMGSGRVMLYYTRHTSSGTALEGMKIHYMQSADNGSAFSGETLLYNATGIYYLTVSTLTNGNVRMLVTAPLAGGTTGSTVLSADSGSAGTSFSSFVQVFSTSTATNVLSDISVVRATDTYKWRVYMTSKLGNAASSYIYSILASSPVINSFSPTLAYMDSGPTDFTVSGEIFSASTPTVSLTKGSDSLLVQSVSRNSDMSLTVRAVPTNAVQGFYSAAVANIDGRYVVLSNALQIDYRPGYATMTDNLFRPLKGGKVRTDVTVYYPGNLTAKIYTLNGSLVKTLYNSVVSVGVTTFFWSGDTDAGHVAASGLYFLEISGPKISSIEKIVLIK